MNRPEIDERLAFDSLLIGQLEACQVRLMDDCRWPWLILLPMRPGLVELHDLSPREHIVVAREIAGVSKALKQTTGALKINIGALGNIVRQLHVHVVARKEGDPGWPGPVWGFGERRPYAADDRTRIVNKMNGALFGIGRTDEMAS